MALESFLKLARVIRCTSIFPVWRAAPKIGNLTLIVARLSRLILIGVHRFNADRVTSGIAKLKSARKNVSQKRMDR